MKYITLRMVAEKAGVSVNTASRAINNKPDINIEIKKLVLKIAKELGYICNAAAVALRTKKTGTVGVVIEDNRNPFYAAELRSIILEEWRSNSKSIGGKNSFNNLEKNSYLKKMIRKY